MAGRTMMKPIRNAAVALAVLTGVAALPSGAARDEKRVDGLTLPSNLVHTGASTYEDHQIASDVVTAISADRTLSGASLTVVVKEGRITLSGSAKDIAQATRAEKVASDIAGGRPVAGRLDVQGG